MLLDCRTEKIPAPTADLADPDGKGGQSNLGPLTPFGFMTRQPDNEERICKAVVGFISRRLGETFTEVSHPDQENRASQAVELVVQSASGYRALEHTRIESFPKQIQVATVIGSLTDRIQQEFLRTLPSPGRYVAVIHEAGLAQLTSRAALKAQPWIIDFVRREAPHLQMGDGRNSVQFGPPDIPFRISLSRVSTRTFNGTLSFRMAAPADLEPLRAKRIRVALEYKCPKLKREREHGRISVLILESNDQSLGNYSDISVAVVAELKGRTDSPDEVYLIETESEPWLLWVVKQGDDVYPGVYDSGPHEVVCDTEAASKFFCD